MSVYERLFNALREKQKKRLLPGNHDPKLWWANKLEGYVSSEEFPERLRVEHSGNIYDIQHGDSIQPALHQRFPLIPQHWLLAYLGQYGGNILRSVITPLGISSELLPNNQKLKSWVAGNLVSGETGIFGHSHVAELSSNFINTGFIGERKGNYLTVNVSEAKIHNVTFPEP